MVHPGHFVVCPTVVRLECTDLNETMLSLSGLGCLYLYTCTLLGLLSSISVSFNVLRVRYLVGFLDFCTK